MHPVFGNMSMSKALCVSAFQIQPAKHSETNLLVLPVSRQNGFHVGSAVNFR